MLTEETIKALAEDAPKREVKKTLFKLLSIQHLLEQKNIPYNCQQMIWLREIIEYYRIHKPNVELKTVEQ